MDSKDITTLLQDSPSSILKNQFYEQEDGIHSDGKISIDASIEVLISPKEQNKKLVKIKSLCSSEHQNEEDEAIINQQFQESPDQEISQDLDGQSSICNMKKDSDNHNSDYEQKLRLSIEKDHQTMESENFLTQDNIKVNNYPMEKTVTGEDFDYEQEDVEKENDTANSNQILLMEKLKIDIDEVDLDTEPRYQDTKKYHRSANQNKKEYMKDLSIKFKIPSYYILNAKIYPHDMDYNIEVARYKFKEDFHKTTVNHSVDGKIKNWDDDPMFKALQNDGVAIILYKNQGKSIIKQGMHLLPNESGVLIEFSLDGSLFGYFLKDKQEIRVIRIKDYKIKNLIKQIEDDCSYHQEYIGLVGRKESGEIEGSSREGIDLSFIKMLKFDINNKFLIGQGKTKLLVFDLITKIETIYKIEDDKYEKIFSFVFCSKNEENDTDKCFVACKLKQSKQIEIFDIVAQHQKSRVSVGKQKGLEKERQLVNYFKEEDPQMRVKISYDFKTVVLINGRENFLTETLEVNGIEIINTKKLNVKKECLIYSIQSDRAGSMNGFYYVMGNSLENRIYIQHTHKDFKIDFHREFQANELQINDFIIMHDHFDKKTIKLDWERTNKLQIINLVDDELIIDTFSYTEEMLKGQENLDDLVNKQNFKWKDIKQQQIQRKPIQGITIGWPYIMFAPLPNQIWIYNIFDVDRQHRIQIAGEGRYLEVIQSFITESKDLFFIAHEKTTNYVYKIDLDNSNYMENQDENFSFEDQYKFDLIYQYEDDQVDDKGLTQLHVRGSSSKEKFNKKNLEILFLLHEDKLYRLTMFPLNNQGRNREPEFKLAFNVSGRKIQALNDRKFYFMNQEIDEPKKIQKVTVAFYNTFQVEVYTEQIVQGKVQSFFIDYDSKRAVIIMKIDNFDGRVLKLYNLKSFTLLFEIKISDKHILSIFNRDHLTMINGHIYYGNNVLKLRYDLITHVNSSQYSLQNMFDFYKDIIEIEKGKRILSQSPKDSQTNHKFAFIISDPFNNEPREIIITPHLHDRKILLQRTKKNTNYFYTSIETCLEDLNEYNQFIDNKINLKLGECAQHQKKLEKDHCDHQFTSIACFNNNEHKLYFYSMNGKLIKRYQFSDLVEKFGEICSTSLDGLNQILTHSKEKQLEKIDYKDWLGSLININIVHFNLMGIQLVKEISVMSKLCVKYPNSTWLGNIIKMKNSKDENLKESLEKIKTNFMINDNMDVVVRLRYDGEDTEIYFFEQGSANVRIEKIEIFRKKLQNTFKSDGGYQTIFRQRNDQTQKCINGLCNCKFDRCQIDNHRIFFFNENEIKYLCLTNNFQREQYLEIDFKVNSKDEHIFDLISGSNSNIIVIDLLMSNNKHILYVWDIKQDSEIGAFDVNEQYDICWDRYGSPYIVTFNRVIITTQKCSIKSFGDFKLNNPALMPEFQNFRGHRFDGVNNSWMIQQEYLSLSYSYLTFVIKHDIEMQDLSQMGNIFDVTPYNYIFKASTSFLDGKFIIEDYNELEKVLQMFERIDIDLLDLLHYTHANNKDDKISIHSPLQRAIEGKGGQGNHKSADLILYYMGKIKYQNCDIIKGLISKIITYKSFQTYLKKLLIQTSQMSKKQVMKVTKPWSKQIIKIDSSSSAHIDEEFYTNKFQDLSYVHVSRGMTYPVSIQALRFDWFLDASENGKGQSAKICQPSSNNNLQLELLYTLYNYENLDIYKIPAVQIIIEFLYKKQLWYFTLSKVPMQALLFFSFIAMVRLTESIIDRFDKVPPPTGQCVWKGGNQNKPYQYITCFVIASICFIIANIYQIRIVFGKMMYLGIRKMSWRYMIQDALRLFTSTVVIRQLIIWASAPSCIDQMQAIEDFRYYSVAGAIVLFVDSSSICIIFDSISPQMELIVYIFESISDFMILQTVFAFVFGTCLFLISRNILDFDNPETINGEPNPTYVQDNFIDLPYNTIYGAMWYIYLMCLGWFSFNNDFSKENTPGDYGYQSQPALYFIFFVTAFLMIIHLLNMLIAIMGDTFNVRQPVVDQIRIKSHLFFVIQHWYLNYLAIDNDSNGIKYIIVALLNQEESSENDKVYQLQTKAEKLMKLVKNENETSIIREKNFQQLRKKMDQQILKECNEIKNQFQHLVITLKKKQIEEKISTDLQNKIQKKQ